MMESKILIVTLITSMLSCSGSYKAVVSDDLGVGVKFTIDRMDLGNFNWDELTPTYIGGKLQVVNKSKDSLNFRKELEDKLSKIYKIDFSNSVSFLSYEEVKGDNWVSYTSSHDIVIAPEEELLLRMSISVSTDYSHISNWIRIKDKFFRDSFVKGVGRVHCSINLDSVNFYSYGVCLNNSNDIAKVFELPKGAYKNKKDSMIKEEGGHKYNLDSLIQTFIR